MDRRTFLGIIPTAALTSKALGTDYGKISTSEGPIYKGYRIWEWTGWKPSQSTSVYVGQWLAAPVDTNGDYVPPALIRPLLNVSVPGGEGPYNRGDIFDINPHHGQRRIEYKTSEKVKERERRRGLKRMFRLIDRYSR